MVNAMKKPAKAPLPSAKPARPAARPRAAKAPAPPASKKSVPVKATEKSASAKPKPSAEKSSNKVSGKASVNTAAKPSSNASARSTTMAAAKSAVRAEAKSPASAVESPNTSAKLSSAQLKVPVTIKKSESKTVPQSAKPERKPEAPPENKPGVNVMISATVSQTTDAATLAAIDTSSYVLPSIKVPGRRGRKPKEFQPENDEVAALNAVERAELKAVDKAKAKDRKAKEKALLKDAFSSDTEASEEELERRRQKLKTLIKLGKERGFLTYSEINDHLPENIVDPEAIEGIIGTFNDMGIAVYEHAPDAESLLLTDNVATVASDDDAEAAAEAALSTVDSDFGRTTDPVRMYMREMGSVELLTREGEIEIAKRIEDGLKDMIQAISACPTTIAEILAAADKIRNDEIKIDEIVDGLVDMNA
ncbi:MAG: RNA polymerase sigma factor RpoD, partial [Herminiimonas sp.]|nr:RNA polymerase sigma factor RpoD [Herminiimonas sp.]